MQSVLKRRSYGVKGVLDQTAKYDSADDFANHIFYHGTAGYIDDGLKPSIGLSARKVDPNSFGGGHGARYWSASVSRSKNVASSFSGTSSGVSVYPVLLKKGSKVISRPDIQDAAEIEDIIVELWDQGVDAVVIGDWDDGYSEQELAIINPFAVYTYNNADHYRAFGKPRLNNLTAQEIQELYDRAIQMRGSGKTEDEIRRSIRFKLVDPDVNAKFNEDLSLFAKNELPKRHKFSLGSPGLILIESGFPDAPIEMLIGVLKDKIRSHDIDTGKIINLPQAINDPVFVAKSKSKERSLVVFTEIEHADGNLMVAVSIDKVRDGIKVNDIRSIYGKNSENIIAWFRDDQEQFTYINENKSLDWLNRSAGSQSRKLAQATKAIDKIASRVGLSSAKFAKVREMLEQDSTLRLRVEDTDLDARLKRAHEMLKKYKANVDPKEASEKIATEIAKAKNLDTSQAEEKIGRMIRAAYREGEGKAKESLAAFGIAETEAFIQTNKPDGTDKQNLTFHMEDALAYAADMGLSEADVKSLGTDRFTYYLKGLNMYAYGNELACLFNKKIL